MQVEIVDGKAYIDVYDPISGMRTKKEMDIVDLYEGLQAEIDRKEKDILFYRGVAREWEDKYNELNKGLTIARDLLRAGKRED